MKLNLSKKQKIIIIIVAVAIALAGFLAFRVWNWQVKITTVRSFFSQLLGREELPDRVKQAIEKIKTNPNDVDAYVTVAAYKRDQGKYAEAIDIYETALIIRPIDTLLLMNVAELYVANKQYAEAESAYLKVIDNNPKWKSAYRSLVDVYRYFIKEKISEIPRILELGLKNNVGEGVDDEFIGQLAVYYKDFGPKEKAIEYYKKLLLINPKNEGAKNDLAELQK